MIAGRADGANVNDLVTVRPLTRPGYLPSVGGLTDLRSAARPGG